MHRGVIKANSEGVFRADGGAGGTDGDGDLIDFPTFDARLALGSLGKGDWERIKSGSFSDMGDVVSVDGSDGGDGDGGGDAGGADDGMPAGSEEGNEDGVGCGPEISAMLRRETATAPPSTRISTAMDELELLGSVITGTSVHAHAHRCWEEGQVRCFF